MFGSIEELAHPLGAPLEFESMRIRAKTGGVNEIQSGTHGWSGAGQLWWRDADIGDRPCPVAEGFQGEAAFVGDRQVGGARRNDGNVEPGARPVSPGADGLATGVGAMGIDGDGLVGREAGDDHRVGTIGQEPARDRVDLIDALACGKHHVSDAKVLDDLLGGMSFSLLH